MSALRPHGRPGPVTSPDRVVEHVRERIERGDLGPGDRLPPERDLALSLGVSRPMVRCGLKALAAMGVLVSRRGAGTFIADGPPSLGGESLGFIAALHGLTIEEMFAARLLLETGVAALAAEHATPEQVATMADEVSEMFASLDDPQAFLKHDVRFHRAVAAGCGNRVLGALVEMVAAQFYEQRRQTASLGRDLHESAEEHRRIFRAIRKSDATAARQAMSDHLRRSQTTQVQEGRSDGGPA